jgi:murein DD-endopeptidase MepM/ murein hydrolase activator NlpD
MHDIADLSAFQEIQALLDAQAGLAFRYPLATIDTPYLKFGQPYGSGKYQGLPHPGVDFLGSDGAPVYAVADGVVVVDKDNPGGYGHYIMIRHTLVGGRYVWTLYAHLNMQNVGQLLGSTVLQGMVIGHQGATGNAGRPHLHFEVKRSGELNLYKVLSYETLHEYWYDPYTFLDVMRWEPLA